MQSDLRYHWDWPLNAKYASVAYACIFFSLHICIVYSSQVAFIVAHFETKVDPHFFPVQKGRQKIFTLDLTKDE